MPTVKAGPFPSFYAPISETTRLGRQRATINNGDYQWDLSTGWHLKRQRGWISKGKKTILPNGQPMVSKTEVTGPDGKRVSVYKTNGYDDYVGFHAHEDGTMAEKLVKEATILFDKDNPQNQIYEAEGCGHIAKLEWSKGSGTFGPMLRVTFAKGAISLFYNVPSAVAGILLSLANKKTTRITPNGERHELGIEFWNLVRIRGQKHGARYPFEYEERNKYTATRSSKRYEVTVTSENYKALFGKDPAAIEYLSSEIGIKPGDKVTAVLSPEEYALIQNNLGVFNEGERTIVTDTSRHYTDKDNKDVTVERADNYFDTSRYTKSPEELMIEDEDRNITNQKLLAGGINKYTSQAELYSAILGDKDAKELMGYENELMHTRTNKDITDEKYLAKLEDMKNSNLDIDAINGQIAALRASGDKAAARLLAEQTLPMVYPDLYDKRYKFDTRGQHERSGIYTAIERAQNRLGASTILGPERYARFVELNNRVHAFENTNAQIGRYWTPTELRSIATTNGPAADMKSTDRLEYKRYVDKEDWEGALNFLKNHNRVEYVKNNETGRIEPVGTRRFAGVHDQLSTEDTVKQQYTTNNRYNRTDANGHSYLYNIIKNKLGGK